MKYKLILTAVVLALLLSACSLPLNTVFNIPNEIASLTTAGWNEALLTEEEAKLIALQHAKLKEEDVVDIRIDFEYDEGKPEYEVKFRSQYFLHEYEIHGLSGRIISCEREK